MKDKQFAQLFIDTIHSAEQRCMAADGPVTKTCNEITDDELRTLYEVAQQVTTSPAAPAPAQPIKPDGWVVRYANGDEAVTGWPPADAEKVEPVYTLSTLTKHGIGVTAPAQPSEDAEMGKDDEPRA